MADRGFPDTLGAAPGSAGLNAGLNAGSYAPDSLGYGTAEYGGRAGGVAAWLRQHWQWLASGAAVLALVWWLTREEDASNAKSSASSTAMPLATTKVQPTLTPTTLKPATLAPTTLKPTTLKPTTLKPTTLKPATLAPTTRKPATRKPKGTWAPGKGQGLKGLVSATPVSQDEMLRQLYAKGSANGGMLAIQKR